MKAVAYANPFVPPEWIAAHGMRPAWMQPGSRKGASLTGIIRGVCPFAGAVVDAARSGMQASALVLTTVCDQMRYAAASLEGRGDLPVFLLNVPSTWQTDAARQLYIDELARLGRFLVRLGGKAPSDDELARVMLQYDDARLAIRIARSRLSARRLAEALAGVRGNGRTTVDATSDSPPAAGVPLALVGGPLIQQGYDFFDLVEQAGARVVLDATETGERTLPAPFDRERIGHDPLGELGAAYFDTIPDPFRRPNSGLYDWLGHHLAARAVRGILFRRYVWCDLWHAELFRLREWSPVPVLDIDVGDHDDGVMNRTLGRLEAFLETLT